MAITGLMALACTPRLRKHRISICYAEIIFMHRLTHSVTAINLYSIYYANMWTISVVDLDRGEHKGQWPPLLFYHHKKNNVYDRGQEKLT